MFLQHPLLRIIWWIFVRNFFKFEITNLFVKIFKILKACFSCLKSCKCGVTKPPTFAETIQSNVCYSTCNAECQMMADPMKSQAWFSACKCKCNTACTTGCDDVDNQVMCLMNCGCSSTEDLIAKLAPKPAAQPATTQAPATPAAAKAPVPETTCAATCTSPCVEKAESKADTVKCFTDCGCFNTPQFLEIMNSKELTPVATKSSSTWGYLLLFVFLSAIVALTGYLVIEREEKKSVRRIQPEAHESMLYAKID